MNKTISLSVFKKKDLEEEVENSIRSIDSNWEEHLVEVFSKNKGFLLLEAILAWLTYTKKETWLINNKYLVEKNNDLSFINIEILVNYLKKLWKILEDSTDSDEQITINDLKEYFKNRVFSDDEIKEIWVFRHKKTNSPLSLNTELNKKIFSEKVDLILSSYRKRHWD